MGDPLAAAGDAMRDKPGPAHTVVELADELAARGTFFESSVSALKSLSVHILL